MEHDIQAFDWARIWLNNWKPDYLLEVVFRTLFMFVLVLTILRIAGKRGLKQLSIFELAIIIALGTAAGDPMFYPDAPLIPAVINFVLVISLYRTITWLAGKYRKAEDILEGKPICILENGMLKKEHLHVLGYDELFSELRTNHVFHLGQVEKVYLETSGEVSIFFFDDEKVIPGLPIQPEFYAKKNNVAKEDGLYACAACGTTHFLKAAEVGSCSLCNYTFWILAVRGLRIT